MLPHNSNKHYSGDFVQLKSEMWTVIVDKKQMETMKKVWTEQVNGDLKWDSRMPDVGEMQNLVNKLEVEVQNCVVAN